MAVPNLAIFKNGVEVPHSRFCSFNNGTDNSQVIGQSLLVINVGDIITLRNVDAAPVLTANVNGGDGVNLIIKKF